MHPTITMKQQQHATATNEVNRSAPAPFFRHTRNGPVVEGGNPAPFFQSPTSPAPAVGRAESGDQELQSIRFRDDPILTQVRRNLLTLQKGSSGTQTNVAVAKIQRALIDAGFPLPLFGPDGIYGSETETAVKQFQAAKNLSVPEQDGKVGPVTLGLFDQHYAHTTKPGLLIGDSGSSLLGFIPADPVDPRYSNPDPYVSAEGNAFRLNGPSFSFLACVVTTGTDTGEVKKWEVGHIQDLLEFVAFGLYSDQHKKAFEASFPIRDSPRGPQLFPWYNPTHVRPAILGQSVCSPHNDDPGAQFPAADGELVLQLIGMKFRATDWLVARNRHTGEIKFLHHAAWGFDAEVTFDTAPDPAMIGPAAAGLEIPAVAVLPEPTGKLVPITDGPGKGALTPSMTEGVYNDEARLTETKT